MPIFVPSSRLLTAAGGGDAAKKVALASTQWFRLYGNVQAVLALPSDFTEYQSRYGDASSGLDMKDCFDAMHKLQAVTVRFGSPKQLRSKIVKDPNFLAAPDRPANDAVASIAWISQRAHQDAFSLASTLTSIPKLAQGESDVDVVTGIRSLFLDTDQILDRMTQTERALSAVLGEIQSLQGALTEAQVAMTKFTARSSKTRAAVDTELGELVKKIASLETDQEAAYRKWLDLTISASIAPAAIALLGLGLAVILALPSGGTSFAVAAGVTGVLSTAAGAALGVAAGNARTAYDGLLEELKTKTELQKQRTRYRIDLNALDQLMKFTLPDSTAVSTQIAGIRDGWSSSIQEIRTKVSDLTTGNLRTGPWLDAADMAKSGANWETVDAAFKAFLQGAFVDYEVLSFGDALPKDDPDFQKKVTPKAA